MNKQNSDVLKRNIETFFERHNAKIQIVICVVALISSVFGFTKEDISNVIVTLLTTISIEVVLSSIKDSSMHRKINELLADKDEKEGRIFRVSDFDLGTIFRATRADFFISGIALNGFFAKHRMDVINLLKAGKRIKILMVSPNLIEMQAQIYHGKTTEPKILTTKCNKIYHKQAEALEYLIDIAKTDNIDYIKSKKLVVKTLSVPATTSFVAHDIFSSTANRWLFSQKIKASFYQYRCEDVVSEPNILIDSHMNKEWFRLFRKTIEMQWDDGIAVDSVEQLKDLLKEINKKISA